MSSAPLPQRLHRLFTALIVAVGARHRVLPAWAVVTLQRRLGRMGRSVAALLRKLAEGTYRAPRPRPPGAAPRTAPARREVPPLALPGALLVLAPLAADQTCELRSLLADPELEARLQAAPALGRYLRPLCRLLNVEIPPVLRAPPRRRRPRAHPAPPDPATPPANSAANPGAPCWRKLVIACQADRLAQHFASSSVPPDLLLHVFRDVLTPGIRRLLAPRFRWIPADP